MLKPRFVIFVETVSGEIIEAFTWCKDEFSGIQRAKRDAIEFGKVPSRIWAEPVKG